MDTKMQNYVKATEEAGNLRYHMKLADNLIQRGGFSAAIFGHPARWVLAMLLPGAERAEKQTRAEAYRSDQSKR